MNSTPTASRLRVAFFLLAATMLMLVGVVYAQDPSTWQPPAGGAMPDDIPLSSTAAVVAAAIYGTYVIKKWFARIPVLAKVPVYVYTILLAIGLTFVGNVVFGTLAGNLWLLIVQSVANAALASGFREWAYNLTKPLSASGTAREEVEVNSPGGKFPVVLLAIALSASACVGAMQANRAVTKAAVDAEARMFDALVSANTRINQICDPGLLVETCRFVRLSAARAYDSAAAYAQALLSGRWDAFVTLINDLATAVSDVRKLPPGALRDALVEDLQRAVPVFVAGGVR